MIAGLKGCVKSLSDRSDELRKINLEEVVRLLAQCAFFGIIFSSSAEFPNS
jgi:hypothetical protein